MQIPDYDLISILGKGSTGTVYKAYDPILERPVAIKILNPELNEDKIIVQRFIKEARTAASLLHPNIIGIYSIKQENLNYIVMEYHDGENLNAIISRESPIPLIKASKLMLQCIEGIKFAHEKEILHRDIKPENLIYSEKTNLLKIVDFGLAKILNETKHLTLNNQLLGSPGYMSPEQIKGLELDLKSDLYSLGVLYFHLLTGKLPFESENSSGFIYKTIHEPAPSIKTIIPGIPDEVENIISNLLSKAPEQRFNDCGILKNRILQIIYPGYSVNTDIKNKPPNSLQKNHILSSSILILLIIVLFVVFFNLKHRKFNNFSEVKVLKNEQGAWQLFVNDKPFFIKGVDYNPVKIGSENYQDVTDSWFFYDENYNEKNDPAFESWIDLNNNGIQDANEKTIGDFQILKDMGVNTIKVNLPLFSKEIYNNKSEKFKTSIMNIKNILDKLYKTYGIRVILNFPFVRKNQENDNKYSERSIINSMHRNLNNEISDAEKEKDVYREAGSCCAVINSIKFMIQTFKNEHYILMWMITNYEESNIKIKSENIKLIGKALSIINESDRSHPVSVSDEAYNNFSDMQLYKKSCPNIIYAINAYMGDEGFYDLWKKIKKEFDRPVLISAFGIGAYNSVSKIEDDTYQLNYLKGSWQDIISNRALIFPEKGEGNSIGGIINEWLDSWNSDSNPGEHDSGITKTNITPDGFIHNEWMGIVSQGNGKHSPFLRSPRKSYYFFKEAFNQSVSFEETNIA
ncbi:MAG: Non-specific serine/threonine protein kinase [uncultured bacterium]|nr:MAG: Non-specific serine/threonine protein kinase [uncultured bacterium]